MNFTSSAASSAMLAWLSALVLGNCSIVGQWCTFQVKCANPCMHCTARCIAHDAYMLSRSRAFSRHSRILR